MSQLKSDVERRADEARELNSFKQFSLPGVKDKVEEMLSLIGRNGGIFATYTRHDISHVDAMLEIADWLIPEHTKLKMTPADWLMITLAIYFHDLGMVVSADEFDDREKNTSYLEFKKWILEDPNGQDYLKRVDKLDEEQKKSFFFQEYIRHTHSKRVKEWITGGRTIDSWGNVIGPIAIEIRKLMEPLPSRFVTDLGTVCESHHLDDLNVRAKYPLYQSYGTTPAESSNVQYAAVILRAADVLHVTKDRTPSLMFKTLNISDPIGVIEWEKQNATFSVSNAKRRLNMSDPDSQVIVIAADFKDERPFFSLSEYISYTDRQIKQSKQWIEASNTDDDGKDYLFPWHSVRGNLKVEGNDPIPIRFDLDRGKLLDLLVGHTIYNDPTVVVRELLQNSIDAVRFQVHQEKDKDGTEKVKGRVDVIWDSVNRELQVIDNGMGMDKYIIDNHLMKVGASFYNTPEFNAQNKDFTPISRFGIGILTCFMVSDDVEIITFRSNRGYRIKMSSVHADYLLKEFQQGDPALNAIEPHGTKIRLVFRPSVDISQRTILEILKYWIVLPQFEVYYSDQKTKNEKIGFPGVKEAVQTIYLDKLNPSLGIYDIVCETFEENGATYELAFLTNQSLSPEKNFVLREGRTASVCLEGILVSDSLPGLTGNGVCAILGVRGNRSLRTTVSRSELEVDTEFNRVSLLCLNLLIRHVENEVQRISNESGRPLSRASAGFRWLRNRLLNLSGPRTAGRNHLEQSLQNIPALVVESIEPGQNNRRLVSWKDLENYDSFWTMESRLLSFLGVLSKDLGKELALTEFLEKLAPEHQDRSISPLLVDDEFWSDLVGFGHSAKKVTYSRSKQQVLVNWQKDKARRDFSVFLEKANKLINRDWMNLHGKTSNLPPLEPFKFVISTKLFGDLPGMTCVLYKRFILLETESPIGENWATLTKAIMKLLNANSLEDAITVCQAINVLQRGILGIHRESGDGARSSRLEWGDVVQKLNPILKKMSLPQFSEFLHEVTGPKENMFSAAKYWLDWSRAQ